MHFAVSQRENSISPNKLAAEIAVKTVDKYLSSSKLERVIFNVFKEEDYNIYKKIFA